MNGSLVRAGGHPEDEIADVDHEGPADRGCDGRGQGAQVDRGARQGPVHVAGMTEGSTTCERLPKICLRGGIFQLKFLALSGPCDFGRGSETLTHTFCG